MGHTICFINSVERANTPKITVSYSYNIYCCKFNMNLFKGKRGGEMVHQLDIAIAAMKRLCEQDMPHANPEDYITILSLIRSYAKAHPTWIFHCD
jgi:hypothetical protein